MIKLFRKFRHKLLSENNYSKYLLYAIGEIVLVVIGILLALQINLWNQDRINALTEREYYERFYNDVILDEEMVAHHIKVTQGRLKGANDLIKYLQQNEINMAESAEALARAVARSDFGMEPTQTTFEDIKSSGNLHLLKDMDIRKKLDDYYAFMNGLMTTINSNASKVGPRMFEKEDVISTGLLHLAKKQNGFNLSSVDMDKLEEISDLSPERKIVMLNDAVFYVAIASRNLQHFETLKTRVEEMKAFMTTKMNHTKF